MEEKKVTGNGTSDTKGFSTTREGLLPALTDYFRSKKRKNRKILPGKRC